jgi:hypothetical protein
MKIGKMSSAALSERSLDWACEGDQWEQDRNVSLSGRPSKIESRGGTRLGGIQRKAAYFAQVDDSDGLDTQRY